MPSSASLRLGKVGTRLDTTMHPFREVVGGLLYLAVCTRPDIAQAVGVVARCFNGPTGVHWTALRHILRYIKGTVDVGIIYGASELGITGYCNADYAVDITSRRSTTGYAFAMKQSTWQQQRLSMKHCGCGNCFLRWTCRLRRSRLW